MKDDDWSGEVESPKEDKSKLTAGQISKLLRHNECLRVNLFSVMTIRMALSDDLYDEAAESWNELTEDEQTALWVAPSYGGIFTTEERKIILNGFKEQ